MQTLEAVGTAACRTSRECWIAGRPSGNRSRCLGEPIRDDKPPRISKGVILGMKSVEAIFHQVVVDGFEDCLRSGHDMSARLYIGDEFPHHASNREVCHNYHTSYLDSPSTTCANVASSSYCSHESILGTMHECL